MTRQPIEGLYDLSDRETKRRLMVAVGAAQGFFDVTMKPRKPTRSLRQNRYYFGEVVEAYRQFLADQNPAPPTKKMVHKGLVKRCLPPEAIYHPTTGELIDEVPRSTTTLSTDEMGEYIERCRDWLLTTLGVMTLDPEPDPVKRAAMRREAAHA